MVTRTERLKKEEYRDDSPIYIQQDIFFKIKSTTYFTYFWILQIYDKIEQLRVIEKLF